MCVLAAALDAVIKNERTADQIVDRQQDFLRPRVYSLAMSKVLVEFANIIDP